MRRIMFYVAATVLFLNNGYAQISDSLQLSFSQLQFQTVNGFTQVSFPDCSFGREVGKPQIPFWEVRYVIPFDQKVDSIVIDNVSSQSLNGNYLLYPIQPDYPNNQPPPAFVEPDPAVYESDNPFPELLVELVEQYYEKGYHIVTLRVYPLSYTPALWELELYTSISFTLQLTSNDKPGIRPRFQSEFMQQIIRGHIRSLVRNPQDIDGIPQPQYLHGALPASTYFHNTLPDYIIITNNKDVDGKAIPLHQGKSMTQIFQDLADWKTQKGVPTVVVTVDEIKAKYQVNDF